MNHVHSLAIFEDFVYWTERRESKIKRCHKFHGGNVTETRLSYPRGLRVVHPVLQPKGKKN